MQDEEEVAVEFEDDTLAEAPEVADGFGVNRVERRVEGADKERVSHPHSVERPSDGPAAQTLDVDRDVGQFGHPAILTGSRTPRQSTSGWGRSILAPSGGRFGPAAPRREQCDIQAIS